MGSRLFCFTEKIFGRHKPVIPFCLAKNTIDYSWKMFWLFDRQKTVFCNLLEGHWINLDKSSFLYSTNASISDSMREISPYWLTPPTFHLFTDKGPPWGCQMGWQRPPRTLLSSSCLICDQKTRESTNVVPTLSGRPPKTTACFSPSCVRLYWPASIN